MEPCFRVKNLWAEAWLWKGQSKTLLISIEKALKETRQAAFAPKVS